MIYEHQLEAYTKLMQTLAAFSRWNFSADGVKPKFSRLICGGSGSGKSFVVEKAATDCGFELLHTQATTWSIFNSRSGRPTCNTIGSWAHRLKGPGLLLIDELDKLNHNSEYSSALRGEIYALLDGRMPAEGVYDSDEPYILEPDTVSKELRSKVIMIGAGTWQSVKDGYRPNLGFANASGLKEDEINSLNALSKHIDRELLNRFHPEILLLRDLGKSDYEQMAITASEGIPDSTKNRFLEEANLLLESALRDKLNSRFAETALANALIT